jgi:hypothetical protein
MRVRKAKKYIKDREQFPYGYVSVAQGMGYFPFDVSAPQGMRSSLLDMSVLEGG